MQVIDLEMNGDFELYCPFCGRCIVHTDNPYCKHVLFVHVNGLEDYFDYLRPDFAEAYVKALMGTEDWHDFECNELTAEEIDKFVSGAPGKSSEQRITFLSDEALELVTESRGIVGGVLVINAQQQPDEHYYPGGVQVGLVQRDG